MGSASAFFLNARPRLCNLRSAHESPSSLAPKVNETIYGITVAEAVAE
jgi:hypothetical protein